MVEAGTGRDHGGTVRIGMPGIVVLLILNVALGVAVTVKGATVPGTMSYFETGPRGIGLLFAWVTVGGMLAVGTGGWLADVLSARVPIALGLALSVGTFAVFGQVRSMALAQLLLLGTGLGSGFLQAGSIALCAQIGGERGRALMSLSQSFYGVGAVLGPALAAGVFVGGLGWQAAYQATAAISLLCVLALGLLSRTRTSRPTAGRDVGSPFRAADAVPPDAGRGHRAGSDLPDAAGLGGALNPRFAGFVTGFLAAVSVGGASVLRPVMTVIASWQGLTAGFLFFVLVALVMALMAVGIAGRGTMRQQSRTEAPVEG